MTNIIDDKIKSKSDPELLDMIENHSKYQESFIFAADKELKRRNIDYDDRIVVKKLESQRIVEQNKK